METALQAALRAAMKTPGAAVGAATRAHVEADINRIKVITPDRPPPDWTAVQVHYMGRSPTRRYQLQRLQNTASEIAEALDPDPPGLVLTTFECAELRAAARRLGHALTWVQGKDGSIRWMLTIGAAVYTLPSIAALRRYMERAEVVVSMKPKAAKRQAWAAARELA